MPPRPLCTFTHVPIHTLSTSGAHQATLVKLACPPPHCQPLVQPVPTFMAVSHGSGSPACKPCAHQPPAAVSLSQAARRWPPRPRLVTDRMCVCRVLLRPPTNQPQRGGDGLSVTDPWCPTTELQGREPRGPRWLPKPGLCHEPQVGGDLGTCPLPQTSPGLVPPPPYPQAEVALWSLLFSPEG